jgi:hypothetical protein
VHPAVKLLELLPEYAERYPLEAVLDPWLDELRRGTDVEARTALLARLSREGDARVRQALSVSVPEAGLEVPE